VIEVSQVAKLIGFTRKQEKYEVENAKKSSGSMASFGASLF